MIDEHSCPDPWHRNPGAPHATYSTRPSGGLVAEGYACLTCGVQTVTVVDVAEDAMVDRVCECGTAYKAMPNGQGGLCLGEDVCPACLKGRIKNFHRANAAFWRANPSLRRELDWLG